MEKHQSGNAGLGGADTVHPHHGIIQGLTGLASHRLAEAQVARLAVPVLDGVGELAADGDKHQFPVDQGQHPVVGDGINGAAFQTPFIQQGAMEIITGRKAVMTSRTSRSTMVRWARI